LKIPLRRRSRGDALGNEPGTAGANARWKTTDNLSFVSSTAQAVGKDERTVRRAAARGDALGNDLADIAGTEELHPETKHGGDRKSDQVDKLSTRSDRFTAATAEATGRDERTIRRAAARGEALGNDLADIAGTPKGALDARSLLAGDNLSFASATACTRRGDLRSAEGGPRDPRR
jgi:hypothetical protein